jgi:hypothetical protein
MKLLFKLFAVSCLTLGLINCSSNAPNSGAANANKTTSSTANSNEKFEALPGSAFKASISVREAPTKIKAGETAMVNATVKNISDTAWPATGQSDSKYRVQLGDHWLAANNKVLTKDDSRAPLPNNLEPGKEVDVQIKVTAPKTAGDYVLELDMVQEQINWFKDKGSSSFRTQVKVE